MRHDTQQWRVAQFGHGLDVGFCRLVTFAPDRIVQDYPAHR
jgi:hypothetical protein